MFPTFIFTSGLLIDIINLPFDNGANMLGSSKAFNTLKPDLITNLKIDKVYDIDCENEFLANIFGKGFLAHQNILDCKKFPLLIGGDHTTAISSIYSSNNYCLYNQKKLGVLWFDAHADFNTMQTSPSGNIHGTPVSILCGHTLPLLNFGTELLPNQFAYYGLRDLDSLEFYRFQEYNMLSLNSKKEMEEWMKKFDTIHLSFDIDCLDPSVIDSVNTPVPNGLTLENTLELMELVKKSNKLISMDLVEYNPTKGNNNDVIIQILNKLFN